MTPSDRIAAMTGPDREVDAEIARAFGFVVCAEPDRRSPRMYGAHIPKQNKRNLPAYTAALDAAMSLLPEGWTYTIVTGPPDQKPWAAVREWRKIDGRYRTSSEMAQSGEVRAATPALALLSAILKAKGL